MRRLVVTTAVFAIALPLAGCSGGEPVTMPDVVGKQLDIALSDVERAGFADEVEVLGGGMFGVIDEANWTVCVQEPATGTEISAAPRITVGRTCKNGDAAEGTEPTATATASPSTVSEPETEPEPVDTDGDGVSDEDDPRPEDPGVQTRNDVDTDNDGAPDFRDDFPKDAKYSKDSDGDRVPDQLDDFAKDSRYSKDTDGDGVADSEDAFPSDPSRSKITLAMENALASAQDYLDYSAFSRQGLIDQLSSDYGAGFDVADAAWAVAYLKVDWGQQAVRSARDYLDYSSFSRQGLIDQLSSPYGAQFTLEEATYAVNTIGL